MFGTLEPPAWTCSTAPYQSVMESYVGLPLMSAPDRMFGTLCHFDFGEQPLTDEEFKFLQRAARWLPRYLQA